ncbi:hypothetical protein M758_9G182500 [Ceratodon purpureus]|nr:hypothetical protein M758_9G182500 [Ceratodon purpureus]KAG0606960.1 hypothetical protein M758_9G182500 [Ceratodon purpureus]
MTVAHEPCKSKRLHAVLLPYPAKGHSIPLLHLAKRLHSMGVVVTFANTYNHLSEEDLRSCDGLHSAIRVVLLGVPSPEWVGLESLPYSEHMEELVPEAERLVEELFTRHEDAPPACIISDMFLGCFQAVANKFNIPRYVLFTSPAGGLATMLHMPELIKQGRLPIDHTKREELVRDIPGVPPTRLADLPEPMQDPHKPFYTFYARNCEQMHEATGVLIITYYELEPTYIDTLRETTYNINGDGSGHRLSILPVGPLLPEAYLATSENDSASGNVDASNPCLQWLDSQPDCSVLYVSFGSLATLSVEQIHELAAGLEASGERFLMTIRPPENPENAPLFPEGFVERTQKVGFVWMSWAPQLKVLSHSAVSGFVTHCGWNSTLESLCRGVTMLAWPIQAEQAMNARFIVDDVKAGIEVCIVTDGIVSRERVAKAVKVWVAEQTSLKRNARRLQRLAMAAVNDKHGSVQRNLLDFVAEVQHGKESLDQVNGSRWSC